MEAAMCTFDSPIARCEAVHEMVLMDETQAECACEHDCPADRKCPLSAYFTKMSGVVEYPMQTVTVRALGHPGNRM